MILLCQVLFDRFSIDLAVVGRLFNYGRVRHLENRQKLAT